MRTLKPDLERVRYWQGQLLSAADLSEQLATDAEQRRLHDRTVHRAAGIAIGLEVSLDNAEITLGCGLAYDCAGRALVVAHERRLALPKLVAVAQALVLVADPSSVGGVYVALRPFASVTSVDEVVLAVIRPGAGGPALDADFRPVIARPLARPHLASGQTIPGQTSWQPWLVGAAEVGVEIKVDVSAAGFTQTPHYFATVVAGQPDPELPAAWLASVAEPTPRDFVFRLLLRRITREVLALSDPKATVATVTGLSITLGEKGPFARGDSLTRLLPIVEVGARVMSISHAQNGTTLTLSGHLDAQQDETLGIGQLPRSSTVTSAPAVDSAPTVSLDSGSTVQAQDIVVRLGANPENATPARVTTVFDDGSFELDAPIQGLLPGIALGVATGVSRVQSITADGHVFVPAPKQFPEGCVVLVLPDQGPLLAPSTLVTNDDKGLEFKPALAGLDANSELAIANPVGNVLTASAPKSEVKLEVADAKPFREGDLVAKMSSSGNVSAPMRVDKVSTKTKKLTLSGNIPTLVAGDVLVAAIFPVRATINSLVNDDAGIGKPEDFPIGAFVARLDENLVASPTVDILNRTGQVLTLRPGHGFKLGDVIGLCAFPPPSAVVHALEPDGSVTLEASSPFRALDVVTPLTDQAIVSPLSLVASVDDSSLRLASSSADLQPGSTLNLVTMTGTVTVSSPPAGNKLVLSDASNVRVGDVIGKLAGWRQADPHARLSFVNDTTANEVTLTAPLDGLLASDTLGLVSVAFPYLWLRLDQLPDALPGDEVFIAALDRLQGESTTASGNIAWLDPSNRRVLIFTDLPTNATFRPEDITASTLFLRGSAVALLSKQDLFVSWLACDDPDLMPRPCTDEAAEEPCCDDKES